jgi:hypothetical protein
MEPNNSPIEHQNVPTEHRGLHDFLYSSADEHTVAVTTIPVELANEGSVLPLADWCAPVANAKVAGVYAVFDGDRQPQYVGYSRNVLLSLNSHVAQLGTDTCAYVRVQSFKFPKRTEMEALRDAWIAEFDAIPPGNAAASGQWAGTVGEAAAAVMSDADRAAYEEKKLKLRKAMADTNLTKELEAQDRNAAPQGSDRHDQLAAAVEQDDWSAVIGKQTKETMEK